MTVTPSLLLLLLGAAVCLAAPGQKLDDNVLYFEPLNLDRKMLFPSRTSRDLHSTAFNLKFAAFDRNFDVQLSPNTDLFGEGLSVTVHDENGAHQEELLASRAFYRGQLADERSFAHFRLGKDGHAMGVIFTADEVYYVDPAVHHFKVPQMFDHVIYRESDHVIGMNNSNVMDYVLALPPVPTNLSDAHHRNRRSAYVSGHDTCEICLVADSAFYINEASSSVGISVDKMVQAFGVAQTVFGNSAFSVSIRLRIGGIRVYKTQGTDPYTGQTTPETYLAQFARTDWSSFCLAHAFTYTDFTGVLGLAYTGQVGHVGGICSIQGGDPRYINTAFASGLNYGNSISFAQRALVTAHEFGHNFGSDHDTQDSQSASSHFVMYPYAVDGSGSNNYKFSSQSISGINAVVAANGGCFKVFSNQTCGNAVQEGLEACDCGGLASSCNDTDICCSTALDCTLKSGKQCSPLHHTVGKCCDSSTCMFYALNTHVCAEATDCKLAAQCDGSGNCQAQVNKVDQTLCQGSEKYCTSGSCSTSICSLVYGAAECSLSGATDGCKITCNSTGTCVTTDQLSAHFTNSQTIPPYNLSVVVYKASGAACQYIAGVANSGYCSSDAIPVCVEANKEQTALDKIKNFLGGLSVDGAISWAKETSLGIPNWAWLLMGLSIGVALLYSCCSKRTKDKQKRTATGRAAAAPQSQANAKQQMQMQQMQQRQQQQFAQMQQPQQHPGQFPMQPRQ